MADTESFLAGPATRPVAVRIFTANNLITGYVHIPASGYRGRVSDMLNQEGFEFLAVTEVKLYSQDGTIPIASEECVILNKRIIHSVIPADEDFSTDTGAHSLTS